MKNKYLESKLINSILTKVIKPGRYVGNELNIVQKNPNRVDVRFLLAFPELYEIGMSSQAVGILYNVLNKMDFVWAERTFAPWIDMEAELRNNNLPLYSLESFTPIKDFDVIGFTLQYELTYSNILNMLDLGNIPVWSQERTDTDPLIIAGGPCTCNPEPMADFFDAFLIGDGEKAVEEICESVRHAKLNHSSRTELLKELAGIRGVYVPSFYKVEYDKENRFNKLISEVDGAPDRIYSRILPELTQDIYPEKPIVPLIEVTHDRLAVEVMRGCTEGCRFCNAGMIYRPTRERSESDIIDYSLKAVANSGYEEISFLSLSISDYSQLSKLMVNEKKVLEGKHVNVSFPSMRLDSFSEEIAEFAGQVRKSGFTFAPEAGSERLRKVINKNITDEDLLKAIKIALENGWKLLKFYFMIGLPTETKEDINAIGNIIEQVVRLSKKYGRVKFNVSISPHSPKSHTPFQWEKQDTIEEFWSKIDLLKKQLYRFKQVNLNWRDPAVSEIECVLGRGDRRMSEAIYRAWKNGAKFDGWTEQFNYDTWKNAFSNSGLTISDYLNEIPESQPLAWDHIDKGVTKYFLLKERKNAYQEKNLIDCKDGTCFGCGIQRKNVFREFADCYKDLNLHQSVTVEPDVNLKKNITTNHTKTQRQNSIDSLPRVKYRMRYEKVSYARYISHLDLVRIFDRACRQAELPVSFSQGFNPRPKISFCQPLALGQSSESEYLDMELTEYVDQIKEKINAVLPTGIRILDVKELTQKTGALTSVINMADYVVDLSENDLKKETIRSFLAQDSILIERERKGKIDQIDLRPFIDQISNEKHKLFIRTKTIKGRTARINDIVNQLLRNELSEKYEFSIHRKNQFIQSDSSICTPLERC